MTLARELGFAAKARERLSIAPDTALLCALVIISPQLFGGAFPWTVLVIAALSTVALGATWWVRRSSAPPIVDGLLVMISIAWLWTCAQAVPLPSGLANALGLASIESAERLRGLAWADPVPLTISYDPGSTQLQILIGVAIVAAFVAARLQGSEALKAIAGATIGSAGLLGVEGLIHRASGSRAVFGAYAPRFTEPQLLTPLMNNNHLGGFMLVGALLAAGMAASGGGRARRLWAVASGFCALVVALTLSRGAIGSMLFGFGALAAWIFGNRRAGRASTALRLGLFGAGVAGALAFAGLEPILRRFETQGLDKLAVAGRALSLLEGPALWLGIGRGAFSSTFVAEEGSLGRHTHPENILVQWTTEWGIVVALVLLALLLMALWKRLRTTDDTMVASTCVAIIALTLQNLVDFSLEMAGIVVVPAALLGAVLPAAEPRTERREQRLPIAMCIVFAALLVTLGPRLLKSDSQTIVDQLTRAMEADREQVFQKALRRGLTLHPAEPAFALLAGTYAGAKGHGDAPKWLLVVMQEAPGWSAPHAVAARWLLSAGRLDQALLEIREAEQRHPGSAKAELCEALSRFPQMEHLERAAPDPELRVGYLDRATACPGLTRELLEDIDRAILQVEPARATAVLRQARRLSSQERSDEARALIQTALDHDPTNVDLRVAIMRAHLSNGEPEAARSSLDAARSLGLEGRTLTETQARIEAASGDVDAMRATVTRLRGQARGDAALVARAFLLEGQLEGSLGNVDEALAAYHAADMAKPDTAALEYAAQLAVQSGRLSYALGIYRTLCARQPDGSACERTTRLSNELGKTANPPPP